MHGKVSPVLHDGRGLFSGMPQEFPAGRYHSLIAEPSSIPAVLEVTGIALSLRIARFEA